MRACFFKKAVVGPDRVWPFHRLRVVHPNHIRIARGMIAVGLFLISAKFMGFLKEMTIANWYGVSEVVDAYVLAFTIATWLPVVAWSIGTAVLVPVLASLSKRPEEERLFFRELNGSSLLLGFFIAAATAGLCSLIPLLVKEWDTQAVELARKFTWLLMPFGFLVLLSASLSIRLQARENYIYTFLESMPALGVISFLMLFPETRGGAPLIWGTLFGGGVQVCLLVWIAGQVRSLGDGIAWRHRSPYWKQVYVNLNIMAVGQIAISLLALVDNAFAAQLGEGAIATLGYANRLVALLSGLGATTIGRALLSVLAQTVSDGEFRLARVQALQWAGLIFLTSGFVAFLLWLFAPAAIALLFQRGAFTTSDTMAVARVLRFGLVQVPFYCSGIALVQWFAATGRYGLLTGLAVAGIVAKIALNAILAPILGVAGIALATSGVYVINMVILLILAMKGDKE